MEFNSFLPDIIATVFGGILLTFLFFLTREKCFPLPRVSGKWYFKTLTTNSEYNPYKGMILKYIAVICTEGNKIEGTIEKIYEKSNKEERELIGQQRTRGIIKGYLQKNYFSKDKLVMYIIENGSIRESTTFYELIIENEKKMIGNFESTIAESNGKSEWQRTKF